MVADRRTARTSRHAEAPPSGLADWLADRQQQADLHAERARKPEDEFGDSWRTYWERADNIRQTYGWRMPEPPPRAENWLPLGSDDDQERDSDREDR